MAADLDREADGAGGMNRTVVVEPLSGPTPFWTWRRAIHAGLTVLLVLLAIRFVLKLFAAWSGAGFAQFVYGMTAPFMLPFDGLLRTPAARTGSQLEVNALVAMAAYALLAWGLLWLVDTIRGDRWARWRRPAGPPVG
jgi:hypothetical protein